MAGARREGPMRHVQTGERENEGEKQGCALQLLVSKIAKIVSSSPEREER